MQFIDLKAQYRALKDEIDAGIQQVVDAAQFISGPQVKELEGKLAAVSYTHLQEAAAIYQAGAVAATGILGGASIAKNDEWIILMAGGAAKRIDPKLAMGKRLSLIHI